MFFSAIGGGNLQRRESSSIDFYSLNIWVNDPPNFIERVQN